MTTGPNKIFDDFAKLMTDAAGATQGLRREVETIVQAQAERFMGSMDLVKRDEFEALQELASKLADENAALEKRLADLETRLGAVDAKKSK